MQSDILIIGGGIIGSSIAYHLARTGEVGEITVIERDGTYEHAATPRSNGGIRRLFSLPENIQVASHGLEFYRDFSETMSVAGEAAPIDFKRQGYLFVSDQGGGAQMRANFELQSSMGVDVELLEPDDLRARYPSLSTEGVDLAVLSANDAWIDPHAALLGFRRKAIELGVTYIEAEVSRLERAGNKVTQAACTDGRTFTASVFVNACGAWCAELAATVDLRLPVEPMSRESYFFRCADEIEPLPFLKTESDLAIRPEGRGYVGGVPNWAEPAGWNFEVSQSYFEEAVWPALARRVPAMESLRLERSWRGHYARSTLDYSPILGPVRGELDNFVLANGFSGHGIMHAPATGRGMAEVILRDRYDSIDLSCFAYDRVRENRPYREKGIV